MSEQSTDISTSWRRARVAIDNTIKTLVTSEIVAEHGYSVESIETGQ